MVTPLTVKQIIISFQIAKIIEHKGLSSHCHTGHNKKVLEEFLLDLMFPKFFDFCLFVVP